MKAQHIAAGAAILGGLGLIADDATQRKEKARLEKEVESRDERIAQLETALDERDARMNRLEEALVSRNERIAELEQNETHYSERCSMLEAEVNSLKAKIEES